MRIFRLLKAKKLKEPGRLLGCLTSLYINEFLTLASLNRRVGKSDLLREMVDKWIEESGLTPTKLINNTAKHCFNVWQVSYGTVGLSDDSILIKFKRYLKQDLASRKVSEKTINSIIKKFDELKEKDKSRED